MDQVEVKEVESGRGHVVAAIIGAAFGSLIGYVVSIFIQTFTEMYQGMDIQVPRLTGVVTHHLGPVVIGAIYTVLGTWITLNRKAEVGAQSTVMVVLGFILVPGNNGGLIPASNWNYK